MRELQLLPSLTVVLKRNRAVLLTASSTSDVCLNSRSVPMKNLPVLSQIFLTQIPRYYKKEVLTSKNLMKKCQHSKQKNDERRNMSTCLETVSLAKECACYRKSLDEQRYRSHQLSRQEQRYEREGATTGCETGQKSFTIIFTKKAHWAFWHCIYQKWSPMAGKEELRGASKYLVHCCCVYWITTDIS